MSRYCLDTSAYSHFRRGDQAAVDLLDRAEWLGLPCIVIGELWLGFKKGSHFERNRAELEEFVAQPVVEVLGLDFETSTLYAELLLSLRTAGTPIPSNDIWIAACSLRHGAGVLTYDAHFKLMQRVGATILSVAG